MDKLFPSLLVGFLAVLVCYWLGLGGPFLLDDIGNLGSLEGLQQGFLGFWSFVSDGFAGPTGRPIAMLTFALQAGSWPDPYNFKQFNVILHAGNFVLLLLVLRKASDVCEFDLTPLSWPLLLLIALLWALLPIHVSSVLYVVQRMVLLASFFTLLGLWFFLCSCQCLASGAVWRGRWMALVSLVVFGLLATLSKESGVLLVFYVALFGCVAKVRDIWLQKLLPLAALALLLLILIYGIFFTSYQGRDFSLVDRLLTQSVILWDYIGQILLPRAAGLGVYHETYPIYRQVGEPAVLAALAAWLVVILVICCPRVPVLVRFALAWFVSGHLLESTVMPLEMYFEHRNYLPSVGIIVLALYLVAQVLKCIQSLLVRRLVTVFTGVWLCLIVVVSVTQIRLWGDAEQLALVEAQRHPDSRRARLEVLNLYSEKGDRQGYWRYLQGMEADFPNMALLKVVRVDAACSPSKEMPLWQQSEKLEFSYGAAKSIIDIAEAILDGRCDISLSEFRQFTAKVLQNHEYRRFKDSFNKYIAIMYMHRADYSEALEVLGFPSADEIDARLLRVRLLAMNDDLLLAQNSLSQLDQDLNVRQRLRFAGEVELLAAEINKALAAGPL